MEGIPIVDFGGVFTEGISFSSRPQVEQIHAAFSTAGFVIIKNHGVPKKLIDDTFSVSNSFFSLPMEKKNKYAYNRSQVKNTGNDGYRHFKQENLDVTKPAWGDLKESYDICDVAKCDYPDEELPMFRTTVVELFEACLPVALKVLEIMGYALKLQDPHFFIKAHKKVGHGATENYSDLRVLHYPPLPPSAEIKPGQLRCGEHIDYGSISLLFQDPSAGLQIKRNADGVYIDVPYMSDAILVMLGAKIPHWTNDKYQATLHRVLLPEDDVKKGKVRQSVSFFVHPDHDIVMESIDGSKKYPKVTVKDETDRRLNMALMKQ